MKKNYIVEPKLIRKKYKTISLTCGGKGCEETREIVYTWNDKGKDKQICHKCGRLNEFEIPE